MSNDSSTSAAAGGLLRSICVMWLWTDPVDIIGETNDKSSSKNSSRNHHRRRVDPGNLEQTEGLYTMRTGLILLGSGDDAKDRRGSSTVPIVTLCVEATKVLGMKREAAQLKVGHNVLLVYLAEVSYGGWCAVLASFKLCILKASREKTMITPFILWRLLPWILNQLTPKSTEGLTLGSALRRGTELSAEQNIRPRN